MEITVKKTKSLVNGRKNVIKREKVKKNPAATISRSVIR